LKVYANVYMKIELEQEASTHATNIPKAFFQFIVMCIQKFATQNLNQTLTCSIRYVDLNGKVGYGDILDSIEGLINGCVINLSLKSLKVSHLIELEFWKLFAL